MPYIFLRIVFALKQTPARLFRLFSYIFNPFYHWKNGGSLVRTFPILLADSFFILDFYEIFMGIYKNNTRPLTEREILRGKEVFDDSIDYQAIRLDERAKWMTLSQGVIYVSGNTINSWGKMSDDVLIHELVHVWQYQKFGAGYITCALKAQKSKSGYNYADTEGWHLKPSILNFNAEQQGDLVQDYFRIKNGASAEWTSCKKQDLVLYEKFIMEMRKI
jgi:hypothetical protein